jgi:hypothetical protein
MARALRVIDSKAVFLYREGFYSFFQDYSSTTCPNTFNCQDRLIDTSYSQNLWLYEIWIVGSVEAI